MHLQIFVEDQQNEAYEILAKKVIESQSKPRVRVSRVDIGDLTTKSGLLDLTERAHESGSECVIFIMDQEIVSTSPDRVQKIADFKRAFSELCSHFSRLGRRAPLKQVKITQIICLRCLECWLISDPQAVINAVSGRRNLGIRADYGQTEHLSPRQAAEKIASLIRQVGKISNRRDLKLVNSGNIKSRGKSIAQKMDLNLARLYNRSLDYFCEVVNCNYNGCQKPCPE